MKHNKSLQNAISTEAIGARCYSERISMCIESLNDEYKYLVITNARMEQVRVEAVKKIAKRYLRLVLKDQGQTARVWIAAIMRLNDKDDLCLLGSVLESTEHSKIISECVSCIHSPKAFYQFICRPNIALSNKQLLVKALKDDYTLTEIAKNDLFDISLRKLALKQIESNKNKMSVPFLT